MSHFATPFIVVNLGCEMIYIIDQRLKSQNISIDKSERVLTDVASVLLHSKLMDELFIPQPVATHAVIKQLLQDISTTSIMKLDDYSMRKLWDLMTMIYKWQLSVMTTQNIFDITRRHLRTVAKLLPEYYSTCTIEKAMKKFETLRLRFTDDNYKTLCNTLILWFSEYHIKISVLLRLGLQKKDGTFSSPSSINPKILKNLGENIYQYDVKKSSIDEYERDFTDTNEIRCLLASMKKSAEKQNVQLQLPIELHNGSSSKKVIEITKNDVVFENINTNVKNSDLDLTFFVNEPKTTQEDLLEMLDLESVSL